MDLQLEGKIALISGASAGIGRETAKTLAAEGAQTIVVARRGALLESLADEISAAGGVRPLTIVEDLSDRSAFGRVRDQVLETFGYIDILINNLGGSRPLGMEASDDDWDEAFDFNFTPTRKLTEAFVPIMKERTSGRIICLTGTIEPWDVSGSLPAKAAVNVWAKGLSRQVARDGITVNCVSPGFLLTEQIVGHFFETVLPTEEDREKFLETEIPAGYFGEASDAADLIVFLCSPRARYITGQRIYVNGGHNRSI
jgi:3-oxoacyl-[acyl-carrier protein] reductase